MTGKKKVELALNHKNGPVPFDLGGYPTTGIHCSTLEALREYYCLDRHPITIIDPYQMLGLVEDDLRKAIGIDTQPFWSADTLFGFPNKNFKEWRTPWGQTVLVAQDFNTLSEPDGEYIFACGDKQYAPAAVMPHSGFFFDTINRQKGEVDDDTLNICDNLEEFSEISCEDLQSLENRALSLNTDKAVLGNFGGTALGDIALVTGPMLRDPKGIRDITEWYMSIITRPNYIKSIFEKQTEIALLNLQKLWKSVGNKIDTIYVCGTDFGTQRAAFCSVETFRDLYKPYYSIINSWIQKNTSWKTFKHSCGAVYSMIPEFIDSGFDILNPVQWTAEGMQRQNIKADFGNDIVFWGGGIDTQNTLPNGTPEQVRREVLETCEIFAENGGFVFNTIHNIQAKVPIKNIVAMIHALEEFNKGR